MAASGVTVKTPVYEGPLDLLLELIERRKLLINDISLAQVTDEYLSRISAMESLPMGETAEFIALAATLLLIKSRSLLPTLELSEGEEEDIRELEYRLAVYQIIKDSAKSLKESFKNPTLYEGYPPEPEPIFTPDATVTKESVRSAARALIEGFPQALSLPSVGVKKTISLEEVVERLTSRVASAIRVSFREFSGYGTQTRPEVIVSFLALLELVKQGIIKTTQPQTHGDIMVESDKVQTPSYE